MSAYDMYGSSPQPNSANSPTQSTEKSVKSCYAVVYELKNRKWAVSGEGGWSEVHLCKDYADNSHRILAWTVKNQNVLMNCNVTGECSYKEKSKNFHSFTDENGSRFGLGFHKSDSGLRQAQHFLSAVVEVIKNSRNGVSDFSLQGSSPAPSGVSSGAIAAAGAGAGAGGGAPPPNPYQSPAHKAANNNSHANMPLPPTPPVKKDQQQQNSQNGMPAPPMMSSGAAQEPPMYSSAAQQQQQQQQNQSYQQSSDAPPPAFSQSIQQSEPPRDPRDQSSQQQQPGGPPPPNPYEKQRMSMASSPHKSPQQNGLHKPQSPYQSTTETVAYSPVQASRSENEQKSSDRQLQYGSPHQSPPRGSVKSPRGAEANLPNYHLTKNQTKSLPSKPIGPLGTLKIMPPKPQKAQGGDKKILNPDEVKHTMRVVHDKATGMYHGLPQAWLDVLNKQFGVKPQELPSISFAQYSSRIPKVLVSLRNKLEQRNAYQTVGIFRLAPNATASDQMKKDIDKGKFDVNVEDVNVYANLIKVWFRDLPDPLLNCVDPTMIELAQTEPEVVKVVAKFPEPQKSIFEWLCDMCCDCAKFQDVNKMGANNLAIVIGPNLFNTDNFENPMKAMTFSGKVVQFFKLAIEIRQKQQAN